MRKLVGGLGMLVFLTAYVVVAVIVADHLPDNELIRFLYFALVGVLWGAPLLPLFAWMNRGR